MTIGVLTLELLIHDSNSLKAKRKVMQALIARVRNNFNLAVTQVGDEGKWQKATLALAGVEKYRNTMNSVLSAVIDYIRSCHSVYIIDYGIELF